MRFKLLCLFLIFAVSACTFQMEVLQTPQPTETIQADSPTPSSFPTPDNSATPPPFPTFTATVLPTPAPTFQSISAYPIKFPANGTWQDVFDGIAVGATKTYILSALKDQVMSVSIIPDITEQQGIIQMEIKGEDSTVLCPIPNYGCAFWRGTLPSSQEYFITLTSQVTANFKMHVVINPPGSANQYFDYPDPQGRFTLSYSDDFAPAHFAGAEVYKFSPELVLQYVDTQQYIPTILSEAYFMLGSSADPQAVSTCTQPRSFGGPETIVGEVTINDIPFIKSEGGGVAAGNI
jgi:hypothetical protein